MIAIGLFQTFLARIWEIHYWKFERFTKNALTRAVFELEKFSFFLNGSEFCQKLIGSIISAVFPTKWHMTRHFYWKFIFAFPQWTVSLSNFDFWSAWPKGKSQGQQLGKSKSLNIHKDTHHHPSPTPTTTNFWNDFRHGRRWRFGMLNLLRNIRSTMVFCWKW